MICIVYLNDTIFAGPNDKAFEKEIKHIMIQQDKQRNSFELCD